MDLLFYFYFLSRRYFSKMSYGLHISDLIFLKCHHNKLASAHSFIIGKKPFAHYQKHIKETYSFIKLHFLWSCILRILILKLEWQGPGLWLTFWLYGLAYGCFLSLLHSFTGIYMTSCNACQHQIYYINLCFLIQEVWDGTFYLFRFVLPSLSAMLYIVLKCAILVFFCVN